MTLKRYQVYVLRRDYFNNLTWEGISFLGQLRILRFMELGEFSKDESLNKLLFCLTCLQFVENEELIKQSVYVYNVKYCLKYSDNDWTSLNRRLKKGNVRIATTSVGGRTYDMCHNIINILDGALWLRFCTNKNNNEAKLKKGFLGEVKECDHRELIELQIPSDILN